MHARNLLVFSFSVLLAGSSCAEPNARPDDQERVIVKESKEGWLGVSIQDMTSELAREKDLKTKTGAIVMKVVDDSPAQKAGFRKNDVIVKFDDKTIDDADELIQAVRKTSPESRVNVVVMRNDQRKTLPVQVGKAKKSTIRAFSFKGPRVHVFSSTGMYGLTLMTLNRQLGEYFGAPRGRGVLVQEVDKGSTAEKAGFKAGDVIIKVGEESVRRIDDIRWAMDEFDEGDGVAIGILRKGAQKSLTLTKDASEVSGLHWFHGGEHEPLLLDEEFDFQLEGLDDFHIEIEKPEGVYEESRRMFKEHFKQLKTELKILQERLESEIKKAQNKVRQELKQAFT
jgi:predicted metalloprotease with PDZ domain